MQKPLFIQIGFNKCATSALHQLFDRSGYKSLHSGGRQWRSRKHPSIVGKNPQIEISVNIAEERPPLAGFEGFDAFFDMEYAGVWPLIENYKNFAQFAEFYPSAIFLLNMRNTDDWIRSRLRHYDGKYVEFVMKSTGLTLQEVSDIWRADLEKHHINVRDFFSKCPDRLLEFDIDHSDISSLIDFANPRFTLDEKHWNRVRITDNVAKKKGWKDKFT